jgi:hypothetical protein
MLPLIRYGVGLQAFSIDQQTINDNPYPVRFVDSRIERRIESDTVGIGIYRCREGGRTIHVDVDELQVATGERGRHHQQRDNGIQAPHSSRKSASSW